MNNININELRELQKEGYFTDAQPLYATANNIGMPAGILAQLSSFAVENILKRRTADRVIGARAKLADWAQEDYYIPIVERTGQTTPYSDLGQTRVAGMNVNFEKTGNYRFSSAFEIKNLESEQLSRAKISVEQYKLSAATEALAIEFNRTAFFGYIDNSSNTYICYGLFNNPSLSNYESVATSWNNATWKDIIGDIAKAVAQLNIQSGNNINEDSNIKLAIASNKLALLKGTFTDLGVSLYEAILKSYPNMEIIGSTEMNGAYSGADVFYLIGEDSAGGISQTMDLGYSEIAKMSNVVMGHEYRSQQISAGSLGCIVYKPTFVVRYQGI